MRRLRFFASGVTLVFGLLANPVGAMTATLGQTVEPITCVYTVIDSGDSISSSTTCDSVVPATLDAVNPRAGRPLLGGTVTTVSLASLRVGVGDRWYTLGATSYFTSNAGVWTLDLATLTTPLPAGMYTITLEERTTSDFLLRSVYQNVLVVPTVEIARTDTSDGSGIVSQYSPSSDSAYSGAIMQSEILLGTVPTPQTSRGWQIYTSDIAEMTSVPDRWTRYLFGFGALVALGYVGYLAFRIARDRYKH